MGKAKITQEESLQIIQQMINVAKQEQKDDGKGWIVWGWLLFLASFFSWINLYYKWVNDYFFWNIFGIASLALLLYAVVKYFFRRSTRKVQTYTKSLFDKLNVGFFVTLLMVIISINQGVAPTKGFALLMGLYGFWCLIYGTAFNFRPSVIGAFLLWICGLVALFMVDFKWTMVLHAVGVLLGYIIPGHIAYKEFNRLQRTDKNDYERV